MSLFWKSHWGSGCATVFGLTHRRKFLVSQLIGGCLRDSSSSALWLSQVPWCWDSVSVFYFMFKVCLTIRCACFFPLYFQITLSGLLQLLCFFLANLKKYKFYCNLQRRRCHHSTLVPLRTFVQSRNIVRGCSGELFGRQVEAINGSAMRCFNKSSCTLC